MAELDQELLSTVSRWCAEAGRQTGPAEIAAALAPLSWDELLAVRALLADAPPARPLGPFALADIARGAPADVAAEREREGRYRSEEGAAAVPEAPPPAPVATETPTPAREPRTRAARAKRAAPVVVHRARDRAVAETPPPPAPPSLFELEAPAGRSVLEQLIRKLGARRAAIAAELAAGWRGPGGTVPGEADVARLLDLHGLARAFDRRERDELLHALRAAGGVKARAAERVGLSPEGFDAALVRAGVAADAERIREERRAELRGRATLTDRVHLLLEETARLEDLGLRAEFEADLRTRLPEHVRALRASGAPLRSAFATSLSLAPAAADALIATVGLTLGGSEAPDAAQRPQGGHRTPHRRPSAGGSIRPDRRGPAGARPPRDDRRPPRDDRGPGGSPRARISGAEPRGFGRPRSGPGERNPETRGARPSEGDRRGFGRPGPGADRRSGPARSGPARSGPPRSGPPRSGPARSGPARSGPPRSGPPRSGGPRPAGGPGGRGGTRPPRGGKR
jgi:hypothetical protein